MSIPTPWSDPATLANLLAGWRQMYGGRDLFRISAGDRWVRLHLAGDERMGLLLSGLPGARLIFAHQGRLPDPLVAALTPVRKHPLHPLLNNARLVSCGLLPNDKVAAFLLAVPDGQDVVLLHQLFGARSNTTLLDRSGKLLWSVHRPPHAALTAWPTKATWSHGDPAASVAEFNPQALARVLEVCTDQELAANRAAVNRRLKAAERLLSNLERDLANADQGDRHRHKAEALAANLHTMTQGASEIVLTNLTDGTSLAIALDPARTPAANMEAWFRRARKAEKGLEIIRTRHGEAEAARDRLQEATGDLDVAAAEVPPLARLATLQLWRSENQDLFPRTNDRARGRTAEEPARPFRRYLIDEKWEVWVGRNNKENDELTHRAAHNQDIWLHAQGVSGSHVILRTGGHPEKVPAQVVAKAASLAAFYSKARNSQYVPVIHTEKRYVRKPRKAPTGTAVCLRDQNLFVEPGVMAGVEPA